MEKSEMSSESRDKIKTWAVAIPLVILLGSWYYETGERLAVLTNRIDTLTTSNQSTLKVFMDLTLSINRLSESVARLEERTKNLEKE